jgi:hypothetical protein
LSLPLLTIPPRISAFLSVKFLLVWCPSTKDHQVNQVGYITKGSERTHPVGQQ